MPQPVFRFAPSPNGLLHLGHARSALLNFDLARRLDGRFLLRIEDIDPTRCRPEFEAAICEDLAWLGIEWETPVRRQSVHFADYAAALDRLTAAGLVYSTTETRAALARRVAAREAQGHTWPRDPDGAPLYPGPVPPHDTAGDEPQARRLDMAAACARTGALAWEAFDACAPDRSVPVAADPTAWGDVVLARKETPTSYHVSVVVDDALQGVTHVVRGQDLAAATSVHRVLQTLLGLSAPLYCHHALVQDAEGRKLSKSTHATALRTLRADGATPADVRRRVGL